MPSQRTRRGHWRLDLDPNKVCCLRLANPGGHLLRCWHGEQACLMLSGRFACNLFSPADVLDGKAALLDQQQVRELLLMAASAALQLEWHAQSTATS